MTVVLLTACGFPERGELRQILKAANIHVQEIDDVKLERPTEVVYEGSFTVKAGDLDEFLKRNRFADVNRAKLDMGFRSESRIASRMTKTEAMDAAVVVGRTKTEKWEFVVNKTTGIVIFQFFIPDASGDPPG